MRCLAGDAAPDCEQIPQLQAEGDQLRARVSQLESELERCRAAKDQLHPKERTTYSKLLVGMAMAKYSFDPSKPRQSTAAEIESSLQRSGIPIDPDTVRNKRKEGVEELTRIDILRTLI